MPRRRPILFLALAAAMPASAWAQDARPPFAAAASLDERTLGAVAGREDLRSVASADQQATVSRNSVGDNVRTGDAKITDNAFQNMSGLTILNVNTGNNVAMNSAMNVTIAVQPAR